jgi:hypothetical protein
MEVDTIHTASNVLTDLFATYGMHWKDEKCLQNYGY